MSSTFENDDDLFNYDPSKEELETKQVNINEDLNTTLTKDQEEFLREIQAITNDTEVFSLIGNKTEAIKSSLYSSFQEAINSFSKPKTSEHHFKAASTILNELTNGKFSMLDTYYKHELKVGKKLVLLKLFETMLQEQQQEEQISPLIDILSKLFHFKISSTQFESSYRTTIKILNHTLTIDRIIYQYLSNKLNIPVQQFLMEYPSGTFEDIETKVDQLGFESYNKNIYNEMMTAFLNAESTPTQRSLSEMIQEIFSVQPTYFHGYQEMV